MFESVFGIQYPPDHPPPLWGGRIFSIIFFPHRYQPPPDVGQLAAPQPYMMVQMPTPASPPGFFPAGYARLQILSDFQVQIFVVSF